MEAALWRMLWPNSKGGRQKTSNSKVYLVSVFDLFLQTEGHVMTVNNDIRGLIDSVNDGSTSAFMWEWFTTKPFADAGEVRFVSLVVF